MPLKDSKSDLRDQKPQERTQSSYNHVNTPTTQRSSDTKIIRENNAKNTSTAYNPLGATDVVPRSELVKRALASKLTVPNTITGGRSAGQEVPLVLGKNDKEIKQEMTQTQRSQSSNPPVQHTEFDNTESLDFDDYDSFDDEYENPTIVLRGDYIRPTHMPVQRDDLKQSHKQMFENAVDAAGFQNSDWEEEVAIERHLQQKEKFPLASNTKSTSIETQEDRNVHTDIQPNFTVLDTPHRAQPNRFAHTSQAKLVNKLVSFDSPANKARSPVRAVSVELDFPSNTLSFRPAPGEHDLEQTGKEMATPSNNHFRNTKNIIADGSFAGFQPKRQEPQRGTPGLHPISTFQSSRASDYPTSSEDDFPPAHSKPPTPTPEPQIEKLARKRVRERELDHSIANLKTMKFEELNNEEFGKDPLEKGLPAVFDPNGNVMTLLQRLNNLGKMTEEDQKAMFKSQSDQEWTQTGPWFIEKFQDDLKKVMKIRLERRKISMKYEDEIRRRQKQVEWSVSGVENELKDLRRGGVELIKGREISSRRSTPQKG